MNEAHKEEVVISSLSACSKRKRKKEKRRNLHVSHTSYMQRNNIPEVQDHLYTTRESYATLSLVALLIQGRSSISTQISPLHETWYRFRLVELCIIHVIHLIKYNQSIHYPPHLHIQLVYGLKTCPPTGTTQP